MRAQQRPAPHDSPAQCRQFGTGGVHSRSAPPTRCTPGPPDLRRTTEHDLSSSRRGRPRRQSAHTAPVYRGPTCWAGPERAAAAPRKIIYWADTSGQLHTSTNSTIVATATPDYPDPLSRRTVCVYQRAASRTDAPDRGSAARAAGDGPLRPARTTARQPGFTVPSRFGIMLLAGPAALGDRFHIAGAGPECDGPIAISAESAHHCSEYRVARSHRRAAGPASGRDPRPRGERPGTTPAPLVGAGAGPRVPTGRRSRSRRLRSRAGSGSPRVGVLGGTRQRVGQPLENRRKSQTHMVGSGQKDVRPDAAGRGGTPRSGRRSWRCSDWWSSRST